MRQTKPPRHPLEFRFKEPIPVVAGRLAKDRERSFNPSAGEQRRLRAAREALARVTVGASSDALFGALERCLPFASGMIISFTSSDPTNILARTFRAPQAFLDAVMAWQGPTDPTPHLIARLPEGSSYHLTHTSPEPYLRAAPIVEALYPHFGIDMFTDLVVSHCSGGGDVHHRVITLFHESSGSHRDAERIHRDCRLLESLNEPIRCALDRINAPLTWGEDLLNQMLAAERSGLVALDLGGKLLEVNARATELSARCVPLGGLAEIIRAVRSTDIRWKKRMVFRHPTEPSSLEVFAHRLRGDAHGVPGEFILLKMNELIRGHGVGMDHPALAALAPGSREAVRLLVTHGWPHKEIAACMGIAPATVRKYLHSAYRELGVNSGPELLLLLTR